jgi:tetratricopeptide (TPR) repeat protein
LKLRQFIPVLIIAAGLGVYHNSFHGEFVFDDGLHIVENPRIRQLWRPGEVIAHTSRPVVDLSLAVNYALGGLNPWGYHAFNVGIHILAALTLYGVVRRTLICEALRSKFGAASALLAGAISLIWLVHPLQTESVTYTIQRGESLMGLFYLLTLYCVIRSQDPARGNLWKIGALVSCALGMATKPVMVTAPLVALLYDRVFLTGSWREAMRRRGWLYGGLAATWLLLPVLLANAPSDWKTSAGPGYKGTSPLRYALTQTVAVAHYLRLTFWPHPLCLDYGWPSDSSAVGNGLGALPGQIVVAALLLGTVWAWRRRPSVGFLGAWFFVILAPTSSFVPVADAIVEHRMYLPLAAVVAAVVLGVFAVGKRLLNEAQDVVLGCVAVGTVAVVLAFLTVQRNQDYHTALGIWRDTVKTCPNNHRAHSNLATALLQAGNAAEAVGEYERALRIKPDYAEAHDGLGLALMQMGNVQEAMGQYEQALQIKPDYADADYNLGVALETAGRVQEATRRYELALRIKPDLVQAHYNLGRALAQLGQIQGAVEQYEQALRLKPDYVEAHNNLGAALMGQGRLQEAIGHYEQALRIKADSAEAHNGLGLVLMQTGNVQEAIGQYEQAVRIKPDLAAAHYNLGIALKRQGRLEEAIAQYEQALRIKADYAEAHYNLGNAVFQAGKVQEAIGHYERALQIQPDYAEAHYNLGVALEQMGRTQEAIQHYEQAVRIRPDFVQAQSALARARAAQ